MPALRTKPALAITAVAAVVLGASGISAAARAAGTTATTPSSVTGRPGPGGGLGADTTALATKLGVTVADLQAAIKAVRDSESKSTASDDRVTEAKTISDELGVDQATIQKVLDAQKPTAHEGNPGGRGGRGPGAPSGTTPAAPTGTTPSGTTPPAGGPRGDGDHRGGGRGGARADASDTTLITAIAKATGKDEAAVKAALTKADTVRDAARAARAADFAKKLAAQLHLDQDKVATAIDSSRATPPARAARQSSAQNG